MTSNLYKVGDWVYCEVSPFQSYVIRKIEELTKTSCGNVEAKVICAYRYQDIPPAVMATVEKYQAKNNEKNQQPNESTTTNKEAAPPSGESTNTGAVTQPVTGSASSTTTTTDNYYEESEVSDLNEQQRYNLRHREVFFSKSPDTIAATTIRAKCSVLLFNEEIERYSEYLSKDDQFYYHLTYDPAHKSLVADKGEIRVGMKYQAEIPQVKVTSNGAIVEETSDSNSQSSTSGNDRVLRSQLSKGQKEQAPEIPLALQTEEILQWVPMGIALGLNRNDLTDQDIDKFLLIAKSIGTFARALDCNNAYKQPSLPLSAAAASREITLFHAMNALHENNYDIGKAALSLITPNGPVLCKDEMEDWSAAEANLFEDALEKFGKDFNEIRKEYLPWKSMKSIIEYYYTWKTTDRYLQQKKIKVAEQEFKLKQVYIPNHSKQNPSALIKSSHVQLFNQYSVHLRNACESCGAPNSSTNQWYAYNPTNLVQLIMTGNTNPSMLLNAQSVAIANLAANGAVNPNATHIYQSRLCSDCWTYWKKFSAFKYPNARLKNQVHKCSVNGCGREFKLKQLLIKHCGIAHGYFAKSNQPVGQNQTRFPPNRNRTAFHLLTTPMTRAARLVCNQTIKLKKLARKPFKQVDLAELNKEWSNKDAQPRNIAQILETHAAKLKYKTKIVLSKKLDLKLINQIHKYRVKKLKKSTTTGKNKLTNGTNGAAEQTNGHATNDEDNVEMAEDGSRGAGVDDDDDNEVDLVIDNDDDKPEFFKYFENKCTTPCFEPERLAFPKPSAEQINKFHLNLISMNRKRPLEQTTNSEANNANNTAAGNATNNANSTLNSKTTNGQQNDQNDIIPSKRSLLNQNAHLANKQQSTPGANNNNQQQQQSQSQLPNNKQTLKLPQKSNKPTQSINLPNSPEDIYYLAVPTIKSLRKEIEIVLLRRLARKPYKPLMEKYAKLYVTLEKLAKESKLKVASGSLNGKASGSLSTGADATNDTTVELQNGNSKTKSIENKNNNVVVLD